MPHKSRVAYVSPRIRPTTLDGLMGEVVMVAVRFRLQRGRERQPTAKQIIVTILLKTKDILTEKKYKQIGVRNTQTTSTY